MQNNYDGVSNISEKFLDSGELFGIKYNQGIVFLEVVGWEQIKYAPYNRLSEATSQQATGFTRLEDADGDDILFVEKENTKVKHVGIGHAPAELRRYTNYPEGETRLRILENIGSPSAGDDWGYVDGEDSPYGSPTDAEELWIPPGVHLDFNFYNTDTEAHTPVLNIKMREYNVRPLDPNNSKDASAIQRAVSPGSPIPIQPAGSPDRQIDFTLRNQWETEPIDRQRAKNITGGGR